MLMAKNLEAKKIYGIDISEKGVEVAKRKGLKLLK